MRNVLLLTMQHTQSSAHSAKFASVWQYNIPVVVASSTLIVAVSRIVSVDLCGTQRFLWTTERQYRKVERQLTFY